MRKLRVAFVIEQALGHITHTKNLQADIRDVADIDAHWGLVPFSTEGAANYIPVYRSNWTVRAGLRARRKLAQISARTSLDALFVHTQVPAIFSRDWLSAVPSIVSLDATPLQYDELGDVYRHARGPEWLELIKWRLNKDTYISARRLVTWASWTKVGLIEGYGISEEKIVVIPPGVVVRDWTPPRPKEPHNGPVKILFVGANLERKGGRLLLESFRALRHLNIELHLVTKDKVQAEPGVTVYDAMLPNSPELKRLYHECDIFALPTYGDCLPMVLSEAGAAGLASISTKIAGIPEIVRDGATGLIVPPRDGAALTDALRVLIENQDLRLRFGARAQALVARDYDATTNTNRLLDLIRSEANLPSRPG